MFDPPPEPRYQPPPERVRHDRLTVAIGNASLLGIGYLLLGRWAWAVVTAAITITLVVLLGTVAPGVWFEVLFVVWWVALVAHGWHLAGTPARPAPVRRPRVLALLITIPVLVGIGYVRVDAGGIEDSVTEARESGDCQQARSALDRIWFGHHVVDGPMTVRTERTAQVCDRLQKTRAALRNAAAKADSRGLQSGYRALGAVLTDLPGHDRMVGTVLDEFLESVWGREPCEAVELTDWLRQRPKSNNLLDRSAEAVPKVEPAALLGCGDVWAGQNNWPKAKARYQQLLGRYPGHALTAKAQKGLKRAAQGLELQHLFILGEGYCQKPAVYSGAAPYRKGVLNRAVVYHTDEYDDMYVKKVPAGWQADHSQATMVVCIGQRAAGAPIRTCSYRSESDGQVRNVTFSKMAFPVKAYELRTGRLVTNTRVEIGGTACPPKLTSFGANDPLRMLAEPSDSDLQSAFARVFKP